MRLREQGQKSGREWQTTEIVEVGDSYPFVFPADQGWEADDEAQDPHGCNQQPCSSRRHDLRFRKFNGSKFIVFLIQRWK